MQLLPVEAQRHEIQHARVLGLGRPTYGVTRQDRAINAVGIPRMGKLVAGLLETSLVRQRLRLVAANGHNRGEPFQFLVTPCLANRERAKGLAPSALARLGDGGHILNHNRSNRVVARQPAHNPRLPIPAGAGRWRDAPSAMTLCRDARADMPADRNPPRLKVSANTWITCRRSKRNSQ